VSIAGYMSTMYAILMLAVTVGIVVQTSQDSWTSPNAMFIIVITTIFILAGLLHPEEFMCLMPGLLYFLCIPSGEPHLASPRIINLHACYLSHLCHINVHTMNTVLNNQYLTWKDRTTPSCPIPNSNSSLNPKLRCIQS